MVIKNVSYEILDKTELTIDILLRFRDIGINKEQYYFIIKRLEDSNLNITNEYQTSFDTDYDESKKILLIMLILSIPDTHKPEDVDIEQIINQNVYKFTKFYETICKNPKYKDTSQ